MLETELQAKFINVWWWSNSDAQKFQFRFHTPAEIAAGWVVNVVVTERGPVSELKGGVVPILQVLELLQVPELIAVTACISLIIVTNN